MDTCKRARWLARLAAGLCLFACAVAQSRAATLHWNVINNGDGTTWSTGNGTPIRNNWGGTRFATGDNAVFGGTSFLAPTIGGSALTVGGITFTNNAGAFTIGGSATLTIDNGITNLSATNQTFNVAIAVASNQTWNAGSAGGGRFTLNTNINLGASRTLTLDGANRILVNGVISGTGTSGLVKNGTGTTVLSRLNTYTGDTIINAGTLLLATNAPSSAAGALGNSSSTILLGATSGSSSATLLLTNGVSVGRNFQVRSGSSGIQTFGATGTAPATISGHVDLRFDVHVYANTGSELSFAGVLGSPADVVVTKVGAGTVRLSGANTFTGALRVDAGTLLLGANERLANGAGLRLNGGSFAAGGFTETLGALTLTASSVIELGGSTSVLNFTDSSGQSWTGGTTLAIQNWNGSTAGGGAERLVFGSTTDGLSVAQLSHIIFVNPQGFSAGSYGARILTSGEVVPVPEPATGVALGALLAVVVAGDRRVRRAAAVLATLLRLLVTSNAGVRSCVLLGFTVLLYLAEQLSSP